MAMTACYSNYGLLGAVSQQRQRQQLQSHQQAQQSQLIPIPQPSRMQSAQVPQKDFSVPLHVDCSVEYELPNQAKPPPGARVEPLLLMIHPCYFRKIESEQRRSPFINNMPNSSRNSTQSRRSSRNSQQITQTSSYSSVAVAAAAAQHQQQQQQSQSLHHNPNQNHNHNSHSHNHHSQSMERQKLEQNPQHHQQRSLSSQQATQQQKMSQMSQQAYYPANSNNNNPPSINNSNTNNPNSNDSSLADIRLCLDNWEHSQMAAVPRDFQAGLPDATPNNSYRDDKLNALNGKYRQYLRSHRLHPYLMASATAFPQLTSSVFH
ncbi:centrosomal and chromosomal factor [Sitodiplosis mosellana]|uniref:centrosomal and chromosomal factor n=1 Tax=Sitodiplosis mosellana TaxID=263140 RepID=UPI00244529E9|nr:centrosomal and chromosomal factor [Sitodiplosis mosellana]